MNDILKKTILLIATLSVTFLLLEIGIRVWDPNGSIRLYQDDSYVGRIYKANIDTMVVADDGSRAHLITNSHGFIGEEVSKEKPKNVIRIANLGDSFTSGHDVDYDKKYVALLGSKLSNVLGRDVESLNFGIPSQGTNESYLHYEHRVRAFDPDVVVLYFFLGNDFDENIEDIEVIKKKFSVREEGSSLRRLVRKSELVLYVLNRFVKIPITNNLMYTLGIIREKGVFTSTDENELDSIKSLPRRLRLITVPSEELNEKALTATTRYLRMFKEGVLDDGKEFVVVILPRNPQVEERLKEKELAKYPQLQDLGYDSTRTNTELAKILDGLNINYVDVTPRFKTECATSCTLYICDDCHLGYDGHLLVSEIVTDYLMEHVFKDMRK